MEDQLKCIIVDDEPLAREGMELNVKEIPFLHLAGQFSNAISANQFLNYNEVDLMFLDIQMPGITGLEFLENLNKKPLVILSTAYPQYALEGFALDVVDYLVKPVRMARFVKAVNKAKELNALLKQKNPSNIGSFENDYIFVKSDRMYKKIFLNEIKFIEGMKDYVIIHCSKNKIITAMNLKTINDQIPSKLFFRASKSYIVNLEFISGVENDLIHLDGKKIPLGRTYKENFMKNFIHKKLIDRK